MSINEATIVLVGLCNEEPLFQTLIGTVVFRESDNGQYEPRLIDIKIGEDEGKQKNQLKKNFQWKMKGNYGLSFPVGRGHGVMITLDCDKKKYHFTTGINHGDSGSSGSISHGGPELVAALDTIFFG